MSFWYMTLLLLVLKIKQGLLGLPALRAVTHVISLGLCLSFLNFGWSTQGGYFHCDEIFTCVRA